MKILHVITTLGRGGAEMQLLMLARYQRLELNHDVSIFYLKGSGELTDEYRACGISVIGSDGSQSLLSNYFRLSSIIRNNKFDVVHTHLMKANFIGGIAAKLKSVSRIVSHKHNDEEFMKKYRYSIPHDLVSRWTDDIVIYLSNHVKEYFESYGVIKPKNSIVIYYGFDPSVYEQAGVSFRKDLGIPDESYVYGTVARIAPQKGIDILIKAFENVAGQYPEVHLLVVGGAGFDAEYVEQIKQQSAKSRFSNNIHFIGRVDNPIDVYNSLDCFVLASRWEGFGLVLLEAMSAGCPIVATNVSAIPEVVRPGVDALLVEPNNISDLTNALLQAKAGVLKNKNTSSNRVDYFSPKRSFDEIEIIYREI